MKILVNGKAAVLKPGFSFEYVSENRLFLGRDGYTLTITFPMKGCHENIEIFGQIHRADVSKKKANFECSILDSKVALFGTLSVVKISETEVQCQFAEGRCSQTITDPFEDTLISDLDLGSGPTTDKSAITPVQAWRSIDNGAAEVALPWVNEASPTAPNNWVSYSPVGYAWDSENKELSWQPYLIVITKRICDAIGYTYDFTEWEQDPARFLIICNTLPGAWNIPGYARALPEWSVSEFFEKLELFMTCEFDFDHKTKHVTMSFSKDRLAAVDPVLIEDVVDSYDVEVSKDENSSCDYIAAKRLAYKECSHSMQQFYACDRYIKTATAVRYNTLTDLIAKNRRRDTPLSGNGYPSVAWGETLGQHYGGQWANTVNSLLYAKDVDTYFVFRSIGTELVYDGGPADVFTQLYILQPVNVFGSGSVESDAVGTEELDFVPACIMDTHISEDDDKGLMLFLNPSGYDEDAPYDPEDFSGQAPSGSVISMQRPETVQPATVAVIAKEYKDKKTSYYDEIFVAFWNGQILDQGKTPCPILDSVTVSQDWTVHRTGFSMRIHGGPAMVSHRCLTLPQIDARQKFKFSWLADGIPNPRAVFHIRGKRYLCEKITATFTENGMSQLLKGEFYPLLEED